VNLQPSVVAIPELEKDRLVITVELDENFDRFQSAINIQSFLSVSITSASCFFERKLHDSGPPTL